MEMHSIIINDKKTIEVSAVTSLEAFDDEAILANLQSGGLIIRGENLEVLNLNVEDGTLTATGLILSVNYTKVKEPKGLKLPFRK